MCALPYYDRDVDPREPLDRGDGAVCVRHGERGGAATPGQLVVAQPQCVLAVFDAERRADRAGGQVEQRAVQDPLERLLPDVRIEPEIRADVLGGGRREIGRASGRERVWQ